jgi:hypothetical protein
MSDEFTPKDIVKFWSKVNRTDGCWLWTDAPDPGGYGLLRVGRRKFRAHRVSWMIAYGDIPGGLFVCHHCDVKACVRPDHLFLGTPADNVQDAARKGRLPLGERNHKSKLTREQVGVIRSRIAAGESMYSLAREYGVSRPSIRAIRLGTSWATRDQPGDHQVMPVK